MLAALARLVQSQVQAANVYAPSTAERWESANGRGDCNGFALAKRRALLAAGAPLSALHLCRCWTETDEAHLVLVVDTEDEGPLVLDNRYAAPMRRQDLPGYRWVLIEDEGKWSIVAR